MEEVHPDILAGSFCVSTPGAAFWQVVLFLLLVASNFAHPAIMSAATVSCCIVIMFDPLVRVRPAFCKGSSLFFLMLLVGLAGVLSNAIYDILKDCWYFGNVIAMMTLGYLLMLRINGLESVCRTFMVASAAVSFIHMSFFLLNPGLLMESVATIRNETTTGYYLTVLGIVIGYGARKYRLSLFRTRHLATLCTALSATSVILSFSRTLLISVIVMTLVMAGAYKARTTAVLFMALVILAVPLYFYLSELPAVKTVSPDSFYGKILNSAEEVKITDYSDVEDITHNWRGYESYRALQTYLEGNTLQHFIGRGFGTNIKLDVVMRLGGNEFESIPILHNGYLYLLVKTGVVGILLYLAFLANICRFSFRLISETMRLDLRFAAYLLCGLSLLIAGTTFVISGVFNKSDLYPVLILLGLLLSYTNSQVQALHGCSPGPSVVQK
jgi:hypothetical protein